MLRREHQLFKRYPLNGKTPSSIGHLPTPYPGHNLSAQSFTKNDADRLRYFDPNVDRLTLGEYEHVQFEPQFIQHMQGIKFVYLRPERVA